MEPKFVNFAGQKVVGVAAGFNPDTTAAIPGLWARFVEMCDAIGVPTEIAYGVCMSSHGQVDKKPDDAFVYMAAVPDGDWLPSDMVPFEIPPGKYAVFTHSGTIKDLPHTVKHIWSTWVPENKPLYREAPDFEYYDQRFDPATESGEVDIYIPVKS